MSWLSEDHAITVGEIENTLSQQGVSVEPGDILLFRSGHMTRFLSSGQWSEYTYTNAPGPCLEVLPWLHERRVAAVASDTWAFEAVPSKTSLWLPIHAIGIVYMGLMIGENFLLEEWASNCAKDGVSVPIGMRNNTHELYCLWSKPYRTKRQKGNSSCPQTPIHAPSTMQEASSQIGFR